MAMMGALTANALDYPYLTFELTDGSKASVSVTSDATLTFSGTTLTIGSESFTLTNLSKMYFSASDETATGITSLQTADDGINSASTMTIKGGSIMVSSSGNDGLDANGNMNISGGNIFVVCAGGAEVGLDAAEQYSLNITGGNIVAIGGFERGANISNGTAKQASSFSRNTWYALGAPGFFRGRSTQTRMTA